MYKSPKFLGRFNLPIVTFSPASTIGDWATRPLIETHVEDLIRSMTDYNSGVLVRDTFKVSLMSLATSTWSANRLVNEVDNIAEDFKHDHRGLEKAISELLMTTMSAGVTIGGNHSREAIQRMLRSGSNVFETSLVVPSDVFYNLTKEETLAIGWVDNMVSSVSASYTLRDKVALIRNLWQDPQHVADSGLTAAAMEIACYEYMYTSKKKEKDAAKKKKTLDSSGPFVKACNVPESFWPLVNNILSKNLLNLTTFRTIQWNISPDDLRGALERFLKTDDASEGLAKFKADILAIKNKHKVKPSVVSIWKTLSNDAHTTEADVEQFMADFDKVCSFDQLASEFSSQLSKLKGKQLLQSQELTNRVRRVLERMAASDQDSQQTTEAIGCRNRADKETLHVFKQTQSCKYPLKLARLKVSVGLFVIDPPFGILDVDWDKEWDVDYWSRVFSGCSTCSPSAPILVFVSYQQLKLVSSAAGLEGYTNLRMISWLKASKTNHEKGRLSYPVNLILLFSKEQLTWNKESKNKFMSNGNFVATLQEPQQKFKGTPVNPTQKPIVLLRSFIADFCSPEKLVVDLTCGSGTTAIAAASLGYDSHNCDIRGGQVKYSIERVKAEAANPSWYPETYVIWDYSALRKSLTDACTEPKSNQLTWNPDDPDYNEARLRDDESDTNELRTSHVIRDEPPSPETAPTIEDLEFIEDNPQSSSAKDSESVEEVADEDEEEERQEDSVEISSNSDSEDNIPLLELEKRNEGKK